MVSLRRFRGGGSAREAPPPGLQRRARPWVAIALAVVALGLEGCQSLQTVNPFNPCNRGKCGGGLRRLFARPVAVDACEPGGISGGISEGVPIEAIPSPEAVITTPAPGAVIKTPPSEVEVPDLAPAEPAPPAGEGASTSRGTDKSSYQTSLPREGLRLSRRPAPRPSHSGPASPAVELLDHLPPPAEEVTTPAAAPPQAAAPESKPKPTPEPTPVAVAPSPPPATEAATAAPGIRRFKVVEPQLAGGSFPTDPGWDWLVETGYKTVLDLREPQEVRPQEVAAIDHRGLRYVALPIAPGAIDAPRVDRFREEIAQAGARPLFFCDTDGARAGVLWYIRRVGFDKIDPASARREAEELGPLDPPLLAAAEAYLGRLNAPAPGPVPDPAPPAPAVVEPPASPPAPVPAAATPKPPSAAQAAAAPRDPTAWRPYGALLLTVLAVPFAYWSRTGLSFRTLRRASLPASAPRPRSLPPASGA